MQVRRCDEMERKLRFLEKEIKKDSIPMMETTEPPDAPQPRQDQRFTCAGIGNADRVPVTTIIFQLFTYWVENLLFSYFVLWGLDLQQ
jgi:hypothetical protein